MTQRDDRFPNPGLPWWVSCASCAFWQQIRLDEATGGSGDCRLMAPKVVRDEDGMPVTEWPQTRGLEWCAQWRSNESGENPSLARGFGESQT